MADIRKKQQIKTFKILFDKIKNDGVYLCEDVHTSYWLSYGGGSNRMGTFIQFTKKLIDKLNAFHSEENSLQVDSFTKSAKSIHYYDSIVVIEKGNNYKIIIKIGLGYVSGIRRNNPRLPVYGIAVKYLTIWEDFVYNFVYGKLKTNA